ncbi:MAG: putative porin [Bacteroidales bacterium]|nr:putative porin [Bacteroidales bacterium]
MNSGLKRYIFPVALFGSICIAVASEMMAGPSQLGAMEPAMDPAPDTVVYPVSNYKARRKGNFEKVEIADSLLGGPDTLVFEEEEFIDTLPHLTARDTLKAPDSLKEIDPWRYKYYVALLDSLTHHEVADSLQHEGDSLKEVYIACKDSLTQVLESVDRHEQMAREQAESENREYTEDESIAEVRAELEDGFLRALDDSTHAEFNFNERHKLDSTYYADSTARVRAAFLAWYNSLSKEERKKYDFEQKELRKKAIRDSLDRIKADKQAVKDSIRENTPRILDTYSLPDSLHFKRIVAWTEDRDFGQLRPYVPDTSYNFHFNDYRFLQEDVNATWLGVAGSPVQNYNFLERKKTGVSFYEPYEAWTFNPETFVQYNTKTPHTELAYYGTLFAGDEKESDNIHIFTTQNITPALNFSLLYDKWGGGGMLVNEKVKNKTAAAGLNYIGNRYQANVGLIHNKVEMGENGGLTDLAEIRDTTIEVREVKVAMTQAASTTKKFTVFADQQLRIPFDFINTWKAKRDTTFVPDSTADVTTAFLGHAVEYSKYQRELVNGTLGADSLGQTRFDNKIYLRLQPWSSDGLISKLDVGVGDYVHSYHKVTAADTSRAYENSLYTYAGARGQFTDNARWDAKAHLVFAGADAGNMDINANLGMEFYPFRKARRSPVALTASFSQSLTGATYYQRHLYSTMNPLMQWDNNFDKTSITKVEGSLRIPHWKLEAKGGYALVGNYIYYDTLGVVKQHTDGVISVISGYLRKEFVIADFLHMDNRILAQFSSNQEVLPLPALALNLRYFIQFPVQKGVMDMQIGVNAWWNTKWYSPEWNFITGTFNNQKEFAYNNGPYFDAFINMQWKQVTVFIKLQNAGGGWPMDEPDVFSAHRHIITDGGGSGLKIGIWWPFYLSPTENRKLSK